MKIGAYFYKQFSKFSYNKIQKYLNVRLWIIYIV